MSGTPLTAGNGCDDEAVLIMRGRIELMAAQGMVELKAAR
jgi:hypothetical protein